MDALLAIPMEDESVGTRQFSPAQLHSGIPGPNTEIPDIW